MDRAGRTRAVHVREGCDVYVATSRRRSEKPSSPRPGGAWGLTKTPSTPFAGNVLAAWVDDEEES